MQVLRIATRKSPLALWQAEKIADLLKRQRPELKIELLSLVTSGDKFNKDKLQSLGGKGLFVKELEEALLDGRADLAVHSMKDVPATLPKGLCITTICQRDNPLDAFVSLKHPNLKALPPQSIVGTASLRRQAQLLRLRPDLRVKDLRGNVNTRLEKLAREEYDALILAAAGLERLNMKAKIKEIFSPDLMLPACGQGALGIECLETKCELRSLLSLLHDEDTALCVHAEREVNALLGGNCHLPLAVFCQKTGVNELMLTAQLFSVDGKTMLSDRQKGTPSQSLTLAKRCAEHLFAQGARKLLANNSC